MKTAALGCIWIAIVSITLAFSPPAHADAGRDMVNQALDLVHQALDGQNPDQQMDSLTQALKLAQDAPPEAFRGHKMKAIRDIKAALSELKQKSYDVANEDMRQAVDQLRDALSIAT